MNIDFAICIFICKEGEYRGFVDLSNVSLNYKINDKGKKQDLIIRKENQSINLRDCHIDFLKRVIIPFFQRFIDLSKQPPTPTAYAAGGELKISIGEISMLQEIGCRFPQMDN